MLVIKELLITLFLIICSFCLMGQSVGGGFTATKNTAAVANDTRISGVVINPKSAKVSFRVIKNIISFEEEIFEAPLLVDKSFALSFKLEEPAAIVLKYGGQEVDVYIEPGDDLKINFDAHAFPESIRYDGKGSIHNTYLLKAQAKFADWNTDFILFEMSRRQAMDFRHFMDGLRLKKWDFFQNYPLGEKLRFSSAFKAYAHSDIDYWWAYNLVKYRIERPLLIGLSLPMGLPDEYYSFLSELILSNDNALNNLHYLEFLEEYVNLKQEQILPNNKHTKGASYFLVDAPIVMLMDQPNEMPILAQPQQGERLVYLEEKSNFQSKGNFEGHVEEDYWYKVRASGGEEGWVLGVGLNRINERSADGMPVAKLVHSKSKIERYIITKVDEVKVRATPYDEADIVCTLSRNEELKYLLNKTTESFKVNRYGLTYLDYFYKIVTNTGQVGWIPKMTFEFKEREVSTTGTTQAISSLENIHDLRSFLINKTLYYAFAKGLYWKTHQSDLQEVGREIAIYRDENPYEVYTKILSAAYEIAQLQGKGDKAFLSTYAYSNFKNPVIEGAEIDGETGTQKTKSRGYAPKATDYVEISAKPKRRPTTPTLIEGSFNLPIDYGAKLVLYQDPILFKEKKYQLGKSFKYNIHLSEPVLGIIEYGTEKVPVYLEPGDRMTVLASGTSLMKSLNYKGKGSHHNKYLLDFKKNFEPIEGELETKVRHATAEEFKLFMEKTADKKHSFKDRYMKRKVFTTGFKTLVTADIDYWHAFHLLNYTVEHPLYHGGNERLAVEDSYYAFLKDLDLSPEGVLPNANYTYFLNEYLDYQSEKTEHTGLTDEELANQFLEKEAQYFIKAREMSIACKRGKTASVGPAIQAFIEECPYETYNDVLRFVYNETKGLIVGAKAPDFVLRDISGKDVSLADYEGKVIYMDFWATWCNPCIRSLHHSHKLQQTYAGKDVVFLYISLDEEQSEWEKYLAEHELAGVQVHANNSNIYQSEIAKLYKVKKMPTYILIDKNGKIAYNPAKNPGNSELLVQIDDLLGRKKMDD